MKNCNFEMLIQYLDKQLGLEEKLEVLDHLDHCEICRDAVYHISRDRDTKLFYYRPYKTEKVLAR
jgi:anti-sigma factor RsiW